MREPSFVSGQFYHIYNRGVDGRDVFKDEQDYLRFLESMYLFNDIHYRHENSRPNKKWELLSLAGSIADEHDPFVRIVSYNLMPNHFHMFLEQLHDGGISRYLHKLVGGFAKYFNLRHKRRGNLFEKPFGSVRVDCEAQFRHLPRYIHLNALDLTKLNWRDGSVGDWDAAMTALSDHRWSSHHVYMGRSEILSLVDLEFIQKLFPNVGDYIDFLRGWSGRNLFGPVLHTGRPEWAAVEHRT